MNIEIIYYLNRKSRFLSMLNRSTVAVRMNLLKKTKNELQLLCEEIQPQKYHSCKHILKTSTPRFDKLFLLINNKNI